MIALMHHRPRPSLNEDILDTFMKRPHIIDLFDAPPRLAKRHRGQPAAEPLGALRLAREDGKFVATLAAPGVKADNLSMELLGNRVLQVRVTMDTHKDKSEADGNSSASSSPAQEGNAGSSRQPAAGSSFVVMERSAALPQLVDPSAITSTYTDGLLRVEIPIQPPALDHGPLARIAELEQQAKDADARIAELCKELAGLKATARDAHQAVRRERAEAQRALQASRHVVAIERGS